MTDLGPEARSILGAGRNGDDPTAVDRARVRNKLARALRASSLDGAARGPKPLRAQTRAIAAGGAVGAASAAGSAAEGTAAAATAAAGKTATLLALGKIGGGLVFVAALGAGIWFSRPLPPGPLPPHVASVGVGDSAAPGMLPAPTAAPAASAGADTPSPASPSPEPSAAARPAADSPESPAGPAGRSSASARPSGGVAPKTADTDAPKDPLEDETRQLREAHGALQSGDPAKALKLLDEQATTYASGQLREERAAARVLVLCKLGKVDLARAKASEFLRDNPQSPLADRVRGGCPAPAP